ncbi:MAG TPA: methyltransferase domain-containing protein [Puia sp.]|nr:methyltransferase domain-containing protein [Puia sp.]
MKTTQRFSDRVEDYVKYRPGYPEGIIAWLRDAYGLSPEWDVADIGSGTGISTELFLRNGNTVFAVEPNREMREKAESLLQYYAGAGAREAGATGAAARGAGREASATGAAASGAGREASATGAAARGAGRGQFISIDGTAEATGLADGSVNMIVAGQAFHWFDAVRCRPEFVRILRPPGVVALVWNERLVESPFEKEYEDLIVRYGTDYTYVNHKVNSDEKIAAFFQPAAFELAIFPNEQVFDLDGLKGRLLSSSYIQKEGPRHGEMLQSLRELFDRHAAGGRVRVGYDTKVYSGILKPKST